MKTTKRRGRRRGESVAKKRLTEYVQLNREIEILRERITKLEDKMYNVGSPVLSDMPKSTTVEGDRIGKMVALHEELLERYERLKARSDSENRWIKEAVADIRDPDERAVIEIRYIDGEKWEKVNEILFGGNEDYTDKLESYTRRCHKLHGRALSAIDKRIRAEEEIF